ncbi:hypothetical protein HZC00_04510 [Candidatus Kaiserbacteria bacterium]|nr:hypothetical protein [Candidatus Kaiserbacteria bacterium]
MGFIRDWTDEVDRANAVKEDREAELQELIQLITHEACERWMDRNTAGRMALILDGGKLSLECRFLLAWRIYNYFDGSDHQKEDLEWLKKYAPVEHKAVLEKIKQNIENKCRILRNSIPGGG